MNNIQTIKQDELWHLGQGIRCVVNGKQYLYLGRGVDQLGKYMAVNGVVYYEDDEELQTDEIMVDIVPDVQGLYEAKLREVLSLIDDGWTDIGNGLNISNDLEELRLLKKIVDIVNGK
ncbi:MAG: hypothetical protein EOM36_04085 [Bacteroidia bacterium]|nr:hypothetical protein [Bacteroidia bacterium]